jgi:hypothetical protein
MQIEETVEVNQREDTTPPPSEPAEEKPVQVFIFERLKWSIFRVFIK